MSSPCRRPMRDSARWGNAAGEPVRLARDDPACHGGRGAPLPPDPQLARAAAPSGSLTHLLARPSAGPQAHSVPDRGKAAGVWRSALIGPALGPGWAGGPSLAEPGHGRQDSEGGSCLLSLSDSARVPSVARYWGLVRGNVASIGIPAGVAGGGLRPPGGLWILAHRLPSSLEPCRLPATRSERHRFGGAPRHGRVPPPPPSRPAPGQVARSRATPSPRRHSPPHCSPKASP